MAQSETWLIIGAFMVRLGVPLAITILVTWSLHRLDRHWRKEAATHRQAQTASIATSSDGQTAVKSPPCWEVKGCKPKQRARCAAHAQPSIACWLVYLRRDGRLPSKCRGCPVFNMPGSPLGVGVGAD